MTAFNFPNNPALNDVYTLNGIVYQWNGVAWVGGPSVAYQTPAEQFFDLSTLPNIDIPVPSWAKAVQFEGCAFALGANMVALRTSADGTTFDSAAADYVGVGPVLSSGTNAYTAYGAPTASYINLTVQGDNTNVPHLFSGHMNVVKTLAAQVFHVQIFSRVYDSSAASAGRTGPMAGWRGGAALALKALRFLTTAGTFGAGSYLHVTWFGDKSFQVPVSGVGDAPSDSKYYVRRNAQWSDGLLTFGAIPNSGSGIGRWQGLQGSNGSALVLPAGGTWAWTGIASNTANGGITLGFQGGVAAGGTTVIGGTSGNSPHGFCWRVQ
jgi:hypothetical protein